MTTEVYVFADWEEFKEPALVGTLRSSVARPTRRNSDRTPKGNELIVRSRSSVLTGRI